MQRLFEGSSYSRVALTQKAVPLSDTTWKFSKYGVFPVLHSARVRKNTDHKKLSIWTLFTQCELNGARI